MPRENTSLDATRKALSATSGLYFFEQVWRQLELDRNFEDNLPANLIATSTPSPAKLKALALGLIMGADCLEDMEKLADDPAFLTLNGNKVNAPNTYGQFLSAFVSGQCHGLNRKLKDVALRLRRALFPKERQFILDIDSTDSSQSGEKMEGLAFNHKSNWGLDSIVAFDQFGFQYWHDVRPGNTFTANGSTTILAEVFGSLPKSFQKILRADSGYCNTDVFNVCDRQDADFVIAMRANMADPLIPRVKHWKATKDVSFYDGRPCEIGHTIYWPKGGKKLLRVIFIRALKEKEQRHGLFGDERWEYHAWVTTIGQHEMKDEDIIKLYRQRGNAENFIKELKHGFDLKHYPCQKLVANKAYGLIAAIAYNLTRYAGLLISPDKPAFAKKVRFHLVHLPCEVVKHARRTVFRIPKQHFREVIGWIEKMTMQLGYGTS